MSVTCRLSRGSGSRLAAASAALLLAAAMLTSAVPQAVADTAGEAEDVAEAGPTQEVSYRGLTFEVPADWEVHDLDAEPRTCVRLDRPAVYLGTPRAEQDCPARAVGRAETIIVSKPFGGSAVGPVGAQPVTVAPGDAPAVAELASESQEATFALQDTGLTVTTTYGTDPELVDSILADATYSGPERDTPTVRSAEENFASTPRIPSGGSATKFNGRGFDTCAAPSASTMKAWLNSSYRAVGIYIGGVNRACPDGNLSPSWVREVAKQGWKTMPIYVGRQAPCAFQRDLGPIRSTDVRGQARAAANDAVRRAKHFGLRPGSTLYYDMEGYDDTNAECNRIVLRFLSAWTQRVHDHGYLSGVYSSAASGIKQLSRHYRSGSYARPDVIWTARWDNKGTVWNEPYVSNSKWSHHQRAKQYRGPHRETHGGRTINIDSNRVDAGMGSARYAQRVTASTALNARKGPGTSYPIVRTHGAGARLNVLCQTAGQRAAGTRVWNRLVNGTYVSDAYVNTGSGFSSKITRCKYPYQVDDASALRTRTGPGTNHPHKGSIPRGGLAWIVCQDRGERIGDSRVWNKLQNGTWVSDWYVATPNRTGFSSAIPRCT